MRQPDKSAIGNQGETAVELFFRDLKWGPVPTHEEDLGTDYFVQLRDDQRFDLGLILGVQVKTGDSWFSRHADVGGRRGFWFTEGAENHGSYWTNHHAPHILVMQNEDRSVRLWADLSVATVESTGKGIRVFVPLDQPLSASFANTWIETVRRSRQHIAYEGSRWGTSLGDLAEHSWARFAFLLPRLVAPHPNSGLSKVIQWPEAIALILDGSPERWNFLSDQNVDVPSPVNAATHAEWGWRFAGAIYSWLCDGDAASLRSMEDAPTDELRIATAIARAISFSDEDKFAEASKVLGDTDQVGTGVDRAWLTLHMASLALESGDPKKAKLLAERANAQLAAAREDASVSDIRAAILWLLFETSDYLEHFETLIAAMDNVASWWRSQAIASGLESAAERYFRDWSRDGSVTIGQSDKPHNLLFSVALTARLAGAHTRWRHAIALMATVDLSSNGPGDPATANSLDMLRRAGEHGDLEKSLNRIRQDGSVSAVAEFASSVAPTAMTRSSNRADWSTVANAAMYMDQEMARQWIDFALDVLEDPATFLSRFHVSYLLTSALIEALEGAAESFTRDQLDRLFRWLLVQEIDSRTELRGPTYELFGWLRERLTIDQAKSALKRAEELKEDGWLHWFFLWLAKPKLIDTYEVIRPNLLAGDLRALHVLQQVPDLKPDEAAAFAKVCLDAIEAIAAEKIGNSFTAYQDDFVDLLAKIALHFPQDSFWRPLLGFLKDPDVYDTRKRSACKLLAARKDLIPAQHRSEAAEVARFLASLPRVANPFPGFTSDIGGAYFELMLELNESLGLESVTIATMLSSDEMTRRDAIDYFSRHPEYANSLLAMATDGLHRVAMRSRLALAHLVCTGQVTRAAYVSALVDFARSPGEASQMHLLGALEGASDLTPVEPVLQALEAHPSARVQARIAMIRAQAVDA